MASGMSLIGSTVVVVVVIAALLQCTAAQTTHVVGGSTGWRIPTGGAQFYADWAKAQTFRVGDTLSRMNSLLLLFFIFFAYDVQIVKNRKNLFYIMFTASFSRVSVFLFKILQNR